MIGFVSSGGCAGDVLTVQNKLAFGVLAVSASRSLLQRRTQPFQDILTGDVSDWREAHESAKHRVILQTQANSKAGSAVTDAAAAHAVRRRVFVQGNQVASNNVTARGLLLRFAA
jgi:hypothetical protein